MRALHVDSPRTYVSTLPFSCIYDTLLNVTQQSFRRILYEKRENKYISCLKKFYYNILLQIFHCRIEKTKETRISMFRIYYVRRDILSVGLRYSLQVK